ncbi:MAG TPA: hypothetical protein VIH52_03820 [Candidatus Nanoarchaeia archaeon]|nr:hypothetical protein [uncultured archaeon]
MATQTPWGPLKALFERFDEHNFGRTEIQRLVENADTLVQIGNGTLTREVINQIIKQVINPFAKEKVEVRYFYPEGWKPTSVEEQLSVLQGFYPDLDGSHVVEIAGGIIGPLDTDGLFVVPKPSSVAAKLGINDPYGAGYGQLLEAAVLTHLAGQRNFHNYRAGELTPDRVRVRQSTAEALRKLEEATPGDFLVFFAQTGKKWGGYSPRNARWEMERAASEFALPAWCVGNILLTNPNRLDKFEHLCIDCPGDEYRFKPVGEFELCLCFDFDSDELHFGRGFVVRANGSYGSASGFAR